MQTSENKLECVSALLHFPACATSVWFRTVHGLQFAIFFFFSSVKYHQGTTASWFSCSSNVKQCITDAVHLNFTHRSNFTDYNNSQNWACTHFHTGKVQHIRPVFDAPANNSSYTISEKKKHCHSVHYAAVTFRQEVAFPLLYNVCSVVRFQMKKILHCFVETAKKKVTQDRLNKNFKLHNIVVPKIIAELQGFLFFHTIQNFY